MSSAGWFNRRGWRDIIIASPYLWLILFFLLPFLIVVVMSIAKSAAQSPPFAFLADFPFAWFGNYARLWTKWLYVRAFFISLTNAGIATVLCLLVGYPMALGLTRVPKAAQRLLLMLVVLPFWTSFLLRVYAWMGLMGRNSWFNRLLTEIHNLVTPESWHWDGIQMMNTNFAVVLVMVYSYLPFMVLPLYANLEKLDRTLDEAAMDLGSKPWQVFLDVTLPLSIPGIVAGGLLVFIPASGELVIPSLVGNVSDPMIGYVISQEFGSNHDWPMASSIAVALLLLLVVPLMAYNHFEARAQTGPDK
ncbi:ABC transporter permease [Aestuariivirga litoralis]|uniref:ABC transporter permease n=1 Tax=Aestuariivirga litoralis TaxID=2650924 RepID=UPI0018C85607|nr:ABC transporter permease [Aestuariivirga litoralis]MBG1230774.1 ABC transporter permease [Aestuariivirga litoralis]